MLITWKGWGVLVIGIAFAALFLGGMVGNALGWSHRWVAAIEWLSLVPAGGVTYFVGKTMNRDAVRIDPTTGKRVVVSDRHSLFFIRVEWWGPIMVVVGSVLGLLLLVVGTSTNP